MYSVTDEAFARNFWARVAPPDANGCQLWTGPTIKKNGYGTISRGEHSLAHRYAYATRVGPIPPGLCVCHRCDVRLCVNVDHLFLGTYADNIHDMIAKGRNRLGRRYKGEAHHKAILTEPDVREIRALFAGGMPCSEIATRYPVQRTNIVQICYGRSWQHVK